MPKIVFLYTELAGYVISCFKELAKYAEVYVIHWPVNNEAPFLFPEIPNCYFYNRKDYIEKDLLNLCRKTGNKMPDIIICSGWVDKDYLAICKEFKNKISTVLTLDNHWLGDIKQRLFCLVSAYYLKHFFSHIWVPGEPQIKYALKLGFKEKQVSAGFYSADVPAFNLLYNSFKKEKENNLPKRFIYIGRYIQSKGVFDLWEAFIKAIEETGSNWELWCIGTGELYDRRVKHPQIKHFGFVQPVEIGDFIRQSGVFVLPSLFEPWGVVVHEMAASGMPLICSDAVGAATMFLQNGINGFLFHAGDTKALINIFIKIMKMNPSELFQMGEVSNALAQDITPQKWAETIMNLI